MICFLFLFQIQADSNVLSELAANTFSGLSNLTTVNLTNNRLEKFSINSLAITARGGGGAEGKFG
jgi:Leucine-rich repeat (LRR) protein